MNVCFDFCLGGETDVMELLLEKGSLVNIQNHQEMSPLHCAAMCRYPTAAHILLVGKVADLLHAKSLASHIKTICYCKAFRTS